MHNQAMKRKLEKGEAIDLSECSRNKFGDYLLPRDMEIDDKDLCDAKTEEWIWSVGRCLCCEQRSASTSAKFYKNEHFECLWLR